MPLNSYTHITFLKAKEVMTKNGDYFSPVSVNSIKNVFTTSRVSDSVLGTM